MSTTSQHTDPGEQVLKTLLYFDIFSYPLKTSEVFKFLQVRQSPAEVAACMNDMADRKYIFRFGDLYSLHADETNVTRRRRGNREAEKWLKVAERQARFIGNFPFVLAVMASGSLSKGYMDEKSDLDFFIVTAPKRLWVARTFLVLYKRVFLRNSHKHFCVNYFVDANHLEIEEKNIFTATELATLVPLYNHESYQRVIASNRWITSFFPNFTVATGTESRSRAHPAKKVLEVLLTPAALLLDKLFRRISLNRWRRLYGNRYSREDFDIAFKSREYVSKNHPNHYQKRILDLYQGKLAEFRNRLAELTTYE